MIERSETMAEQNLNPQGYNYGLEPKNINPFWGNGGGGDIGDININVYVGEEVGTPYGYCEKYQDEETGEWNLDFYFENIKGEQGEPGEPGGGGGNSLFPYFNMSQGVSHNFVFENVFMNSFGQTTNPYLTNDNYCTTPDNAGIIAVAQDDDFAKIFDMFDAITDDRMGAQIMVPARIEFMVSSITDSNSDPVYHKTVNPFIVSPATTWVVLERAGEDTIYIYPQFEKIASNQRATELTLTRNNGVYTMQLVNLGWIEILDTEAQYYANGEFMIQIPKFAEVPV